MTQQWTVSDPRFDKPSGQDSASRDVYGGQYDAPPPPPRSIWKNCLIGCLVMMGIGLLVLVVAGFWLSRNWRGLFANFGEQAINQMVDESGLPLQEKGEVKEQVERVTKSFADGKISMEQSQAIVEKLMQSPLMPSLVVIAVDKQYFNKSKLSNEEKVEGRQTLNRFACGVFDGKIDEDGFDTVFEKVADRDEDGEWRLRARVSDDELRAALTEAKAQADDAKIPDKPPEIDPSDEVKRIIDESLKAPPVEAEPAEAESE